MRAAGLRWWRRVVVAAVVVAVLSPALRDRDSFPLSTYPVYADVRPRTATFATALGVVPDGRQRRLSMRTMAATDDPLIAQSRLASMVGSGRAEELCRDIARRAARDVITILVVRETHDVVEAAAGRPSLRQREVLATCARR